MTTAEDNGGAATRRVLVVLPTWLGDTVMAVPCLRALRRRYARAEIHLLGRPLLRELLGGAPWHDRFIAWPARGAARLGVWRALRAERYDLAVLLPNSFITALAVRLGGARRRVGYARDGRAWLLTRALPGRVGAVDQVASFLALAAACGCDADDDTLELPVSEDDVRAAAPFFEALPRRPRVLLNPGAQWPSKRWPAERFAATADALMRDRGAGVGVICGPGEEHLARAVADRAAAGVTAFVAPTVPLGGMKALIGAADLLITNDSGPSHIAKAVGTPVVTVFGPVAPSHTAAGLPSERAVCLDLSCGPCHKPVCPHRHQRCMKDIAAADVLAAAGELLDAAGPGRKI